MRGRDGSEKGTTGERGPGRGAARPCGVGGGRGKASLRNSKSGKRKQAFEGGGGEGRRGARGRRMVGGQGRGIGLPWLKRGVRRVAGRPRLLSLYTAFQWQARFATRLTATPWWSPSACALQPPKPHFALPQTASALRPPENPPPSSPTQVDGDPFVEPECVCGKVFCFKCLKDPHTPCTCKMCVGVGPGS